MQRRLAAIVAADMVGYSRLMGADEEGVIARQRDLFAKIVQPDVAANNGRIVKTTGDGLLAEFTSVMDAVQFAISAQQKISLVESGAEISNRIRYRVGVHVGDVVVEADDILGETVNIAARLETISDPGGVCISATAFNSIKSNIQAEFAPLGPQRLKNIVEPVHAWRWRGASTTPAANDLASGNTVPRRSGKPSIAVLPFSNMSGDPEQEYFADGIAEDLITELSRMPWFFVTGRNTSFTYKGRAIDLKAAGEEMGVSYILEGSVRRAANRLRITAQLIDTDSGNHVWADRYDREIVDIFAIQDEITKSIVGAIAPEFVNSELRKSRNKDPAQLDAWECVMQGRSHVWKLGRNDAEIARTLFEKAIAASPGGVMGLADLALVHFLDTFYRWSPSPDKSMKAMLGTALRAVEADANDTMALTILAWAYLFSYKWEEAIETIDRAVAISPNFAPALGVRGTIYACIDEPDIAIPAIQEALDRSPVDGFLPFWLMGLFWAYHTIQDYANAVACARRAVRIAPDNPTFRRQLAVAYSMLGQTENGKQALADYLDLDPAACVEDVMNIPARNRQTLDRYAEILRDMGLPDKKATDRQNCD